MCNQPRAAHALRSDQKFLGGGGWVASYPLLSQAPTPVEVELGCDNNCRKMKAVVWKLKAENLGLEAKGLELNYMMIRQR